MGAGLVTMAVPQAIYPVLAAHLREATWLLLPHDMGVLNADAVEVFREEAGSAESLLLGPGLGDDEQTEAFIRGLLHGNRQARRGSIGFVAPQARSASGEEAGLLLGPLVIDADGLNLLARMEKWWAYLPAGTILTPHPGEMARLTGLGREEILADRLAVVMAKSAEWQCNIVLKGAFTTVAAPDGRLTVMPFATDALATAGTGDVLAGCIAGLLAQGAKPYEAAIAGAYVHGLAGRLAGKKLGRRSVMAGDLLDSLPDALVLLENT
jgi:NAD(P)H-hydrate epimerase